MGAFFQPLLALTQLLLRDAAEAVQAAGAALFAALFTCFADPGRQKARAASRPLLQCLCFGRGPGRLPRLGHRVNTSLRPCGAQEVLRALVSHLGTQCAAEATAALGVLLRLSREDEGAMLQHADFLTSVLDYAENYGDEQVQQVRRRARCLACSGQQSWAHSCCPCLRLAARRHSCCLGRSLLPTAGRWMAQRGGPGADAGTQHRMAGRERNNRVQHSNRLFPTTDRSTMHFLQV